MLPDYVADDDKTAKTPGVPSITPPSICASGDVRLIRLSARLDSARRTIRGRGGLRGLPKPPRVAAGCLGWSGDEGRGNSGKRSQSPPRVAKAARPNILGQRDDVAFGTVDERGEPPSPLCVTMMIMPGPRRYLAARRVLSRLSGANPRAQAQFCSPRAQLYQL